MDYETKHFTLPLICLYIFVYPMGGHQHLRGSGGVDIFRKTARSCEEKTKKKEKKKKHRTDENTIKLLNVCLNWFFSIDRYTFSFLWYLKWRNFFCRTFFVCSLSITYVRNKNLRMKTTKTKHSLNWKKHPEEWPFLDFQNEVTLKNTHLLSFVIKHDECKTS